MQNWPPFVRALYRLGKYLVSGAGATVVNLGSLFILTEYAHVYYLYSAIIAFLIAFGFSFILQKFWTFDAGGRGNAKLQLGLFLAISLINLGLTELLLYLLVSILHVWYFGAAVFIGGILAILSYFIYRYFVFL